MIKLILKRFTPIQVFDVDFFIFRWTRQYVLCVFIIWKSCLSKKRTSPIEEQILKNKQRTNRESMSKLHLWNSPTCTSRNGPLRSGRLSSSKASLLRLYLDSDVLTLTKSSPIIESTITSITPCPIISASSLVSFPGRSDTGSSIGVSRFQNETFV